MTPGLKPSSRYSIDWSVNVSRGGTFFVIAHSLPTRYSWHIRFDHGGLDTQLPDLCTPVRASTLEINGSRVVPGSCDLAFPTLPVATERHVLAQTLCGYAQHRVDAQFGSVSGLYLVPRNVDVSLFDAAATQPSGGFDGHLRLADESRRPLHWFIETPNASPAIIALLSALIASPGGNGVIGAKLRPHAYTIEAIPQWHLNGVLLVIEDASVIPVRQVSELIQDVLAAAPTQAQLDRARDQAVVNHIVAAFGSVRSLARHALFAILSKWGPPVLSLMAIDESVSRAQFQAALEGARMHTQNSMGRADVNDDR